MNAAQRNRTAPHPSTMTALGAYLWQVHGVGSTYWEGARVGQRRFAEMTGISKETLRTYQEPRNPGHWVRPQEPTLRAIAEALNVPLIDLKELVDEDARYTMPGGSVDTVIRNIRKHDIADLVRLRDTVDREIEEREDG